MNPDKYNSEGYYDPTPYYAIQHLERQEIPTFPYRPVVYVCSPLAGNVQENQKAARRYCRFTVDRGKIPVAPHLLFPQFMDDENQTDRALTIFMDIVLLSKCSELWVFGNTVSKGMSAEISYARRKGKMIRWYDSDCKEVRK